MIIVRLMGGLGNQMFQYAFGVYLSSKHNTNLVVDTGLLYVRDSINEYAVYRNLDLDIFDIKLEAVSKSTVFDYGCTSEGTVIDKVIRKLKYYLFGKPDVIIQNNHDFIEKYLQTVNNSCIVGRWQSSRYFENIDIKNIFIFKEGLLPGNYLISEQIKDNNSVSIHVRRGDYVTNDYYSQKIGALDLNYYEQAVELIKKKVDNPVFYIFSDDIDWVKSNFRKKKEFVYVQQKKNKRGMKEDLHLMSLCKNHIISNSTFSWWGAYLAQGDNVIAPKHWANDEDFIPPFIYPENWKIL